MLRKIMVVIITFTLFLGVITPVGYGAVKSSILTKAEAEKLAREKLDLGKDYKLQYGNLNTRDIQQRQFWNLAFEGDKKNASVVMAADSGEIISFNQWNGNNEEKAVNLLQDEAKKIAVDFIKSLEAERFNETEEVTVKAPTVIPYDIKINYTDNDSYHFMFVRKINGEFFPSNYFRITVSGLNKSISSYEMKWDIGSYESNKQLLNEEEARGFFEKEDRLQLKYVRLNKYNKEDSKNVVLTPVYIYTPKETDKIDAITGKLLTSDQLYNWNYYGYPIYREDSSNANEMMAKEASNGGVEMIPDDGVISKEKVEQIIINILKEHVDIEGIKLNSGSYTNYYAGIKGKFWYVYWNSDEGDKYLNSVLNAENGQVLELSYNKSEGYQPVQEVRDLKTTENIKENVRKSDDTLSIVNEKIQTMFPKTKGALKLEIKSDNVIDKDKAYVSSSRYINNILFDDNYVHMTYNDETEEISSLRYRWYDVDVQKSSSMLTKEKAHKIFYDNVGLEKYLVQLKDLEKLEKEGLEIPTKELLSVYAIKSFGFNYIDGVTGKFLNYSGEEFKKEQSNQTQFTDIKGSPYEKDILLIDKMGILKVTEQTFKPEEALLRKDALKWIVEIGWSNKAYYVDRYYNGSNENKGKDYFKDISKDSPYYKYIETGVEFGIIDEGDYFKPDEKISKIELAKWIINAMKQKELANYSNIFQVPYKDKEVIKTEDIGYAALAKYYNIFGDKNIEAEFSPNKNLNRGEFIHFMYQLIRDYEDMKN
ncbi:S-layer homology domain-containing protein [Alkaliphilus sp. B6464]|uniref:S-layer homology domain-containing protein n=1 Tax=Alkaliphilus sp. B6464 TaxID=2731219 RepID=UPI001BA6C0D7|nr:S-layer homology domain-containing protein [Alkaliphilus sp. B6464]QUH20300.1 S-layer homology domain-containing protein [Alkaliphilus sp. B6464]